MSCRRISCWATVEARAEAAQHAREDVVTGHVGQAQRELLGGGDDQVAGGGLVHGGDLDDSDQPVLDQADRRARDHLASPYRDTGERGAALAHAHDRRVGALPRLAAGAMAGDPGVGGVDVEPAVLHRIDRLPPAAGRQ